MLLQVILINRNRKKLSGAGVTLIENAVMGLNWVRQIKYIMGNIGLRSWVQIFTPPSLFNKFYISSCYCCYKSLSMSCVCILSILPQRNTLVSITLTTPRHSRPTLAPHFVTWILMIRHLGVCMTDILEWTARCMWLCVNICVLCEYGYIITHSFKFIYTRGSSNRCSTLTSCKPILHLSNNLNSQTTKSRNITPKQTSLSKLHSRNTGSIKTVFGEVFL